jgi:DNA-binding transcriptional MerR regulator
MGTHHPIRKHVPAPEIPDKLYFRIGDVARLCEVPAYVLRFWETEFPQLKPNKGGTGQRLYRRKDVEMALRIKSLLYDQGYTIPGARQALKTDAKPQAAAFPPPLEAVPEAATASGAAFVREKLGPPASELDRDKIIAGLRAELRALQTMLGKPSAPAGADKVKAMRPRLAVVEAAPAPRPVKQPKTLTPFPVQQQPGLFGFDDDGPLAS